MDNEKQFLWGNKTQIPQYKKEEGLSTLLVFPMHVHLISEKSSYFLGSYKNIHLLDETSNCTNKIHFGWFAGSYKPYWVNTLALPDLTITCPDRSYWTQWTWYCWMSTQCTSLGELMPNSSRKNIHQCRSSQIGWSPAR